MENNDTGSGVDFGTKWVFFSNSWVSKTLGQKKFGEIWIRFERDRAKIENEKVGTALRQVTCRVA